MYDQTDWIESSYTGNYVGVVGGAVVATVYLHSSGMWQIIINAEPKGRLVADENFATPQEGMHRADAILKGSQCEYASDTKRIHTDWIKQGKRHNSAPTYGRKCGNYSVTVQMAESEKWYFVIYQGPKTEEPIGWFDTAEEAMMSFDAEHAPRRPQPA